MHHFCGLFPSSTAVLFTTRRKKMRMRSLLQAKYGALKFHLPLMILIPRLTFTCFSKYSGVESSCTNKEATYMEVTISNNILANNNDKNEQPSTTMRKKTHYCQLRRTYTKEMLKKTIRWFRWWTKGLKKPASVGPRTHYQSHDLCSLSNILTKKLGTLSKT